MGILSVAPIITTIYLTNTPKQKEREEKISLLPLIQVPEEDHIPLSNGTGESGEAVDGSGSPGGAGGTESKDGTPPAGENQESTNQAGDKGNADSSSGQDKGKSTEDGEKKEKQQDENGGGKDEETQKGQDDAKQDQASNAQGQENNQEQSSGDSNQPQSMGDSRSGNNSEMNEEELEKLIASLIKKMNAHIPEWTSNLKSFENNFEMMNEVEMLNNALNLLDKKSAKPASD
ncbi:hypothetical protein MHSWG343_04540 [Candidatus Mycoplasma haematohominis]|uniref:Uncharacterized protein n=2 Tax=Candidatus Mycoplasma haematohominis TaxID=1494318 RepID=A0A478FQR7_9MOLU|nr:hypothetical protein MHSWG343_04540 [Candidatus Mycoplasma haemohominis]